MSVPDWLLVSLGLVGLVIVLGMLGHWLGVALIVGGVLGLVIGVYA